MVKILDMGLARLGDWFRAGSAGLTKMGQVIGTPDYADGTRAHNVDIRADIYSLGYHL